MFKGKSLKFKLILSFCVVAVITLVVGFIGWSSVTKLNNYVRLIGKNNLPAIRSVNIMNESIINEMNASRSILLTGINDDIVERLENASKEAKERAEIGFNMFKELPKTERENK